jgi:molybdopterin molybdotransferase
LPVNSLSLISGPLPVVSLSSRQPCRHISAASNHHRQGTLNQYPAAIVIHNMLTLSQALNIVKTKMTAAEVVHRCEVVPLRDAAGRILADAVSADRDYPPFNRSIRDGFAVRAADVSSPPVELHLRGEIRAGSHFTGAVEAGECVSIMTGAPMPKGSDAVVMVEYAESRNGKVIVTRVVKAGENVVPQGSEVQQGTVVLPRGKRLGGAELGLLAQVGRSNVPVFERPVVAILPTGDEIVPVNYQPEWFQIRNSNAVSLGAQVAAAGATARILDVAQDQPDALRKLIKEGLSADILILSGGVSAGKYDYVEQVLADMGAEFYFESVAMRPGKPLVFGRVQGKFFFGLPGNPVSTFVTFALFVRPALAVLAGGYFEPSMFLRARLEKPIKQRTGLTAFLPAHVSCESSEPMVSLIGWQGSGDLVGLAAANCFLVIHPEQTEFAAGDWVDVMAKES